MKLTILERILLSNLLPKQEDIVTLKIVRDLKSDLSFGEKELKDHNIKATGGATQWNAKSADYEAEIPIGERATEICVKALKDANGNKILTEQHITLWDKFIKE